MDASVLELESSFLVQYLATPETTKLLGGPQGGSELEVCSGEIEPAIGGLSHP